MILSYEVLPSHFPADLSPPISRLEGIGYILWLIVSRIPEGGAYQHLACARTGTRVLYTWSVSLKEAPIDLKLIRFPGNLPEIFQSQVGVPDFKYQRLYGDVVLIKGAFGVSFL